MKEFEVVPIDAEFKQKIEIAADELDQSLLRLTPPANSDGTRKMKEVLRTLHTYTSEDTLFTHKNTSPVSGLEYWYNRGYQTSGKKENFEYLLYAPSNSRAKLMRKQLDTHYDGCNIETENSRIFSINEGEYIAGGRLKLKHHYFEPIKNIDGTSSFEYNPFQSIIGEIHTRDDMRAIIQVLYKPAEEDWTHLNTKNVEEYSEKKTNEVKTESKFFGLKTTEIEPSRKEKKAAKDIKEQVSKLAYYVNIRFFLVGSNKDQIKRRAEELENLFEIEFKSPLGQQFTVCNHNNKAQVKQEFIDTVLRRPVKMYQPERPTEYVKSVYSSGSEVMIFTIPELATVASIPNKNELPSSPINWNDEPVSGNIPSSSGYGPITDADKEKLKEIRQKSSANFDSEDTETDFESQEEEKPSSEETDESKKSEDSGDSKADIDDLLDG